MGDNWHKLEPHTNGNGVICLRTTYCKNKILVTPRRFGAIGLPFGQQTQRRRCPVVHGGELSYKRTTPPPSYETSRPDSWALWA